MSFVVNDLRCQKIHMRKLLIVFWMGLVCAAPSTGQSRIDCSSFDSRILHCPVRYCVMLPPNYDKEAKKYPVLYFFHGLGENEQALMRSGGWGLIEDLLRTHKIGDFIMVAPEGRGSFFINSADGQNRYNDFLLQELLPQVETHYRIIRTRKSRGVTGLSMGGYGGLRLAFAHPELIGSVSAQSPALITETPSQLNADLKNAGPLAKLLGSVFGNPIDVPHWKQNSPFELARKNQVQLKTQAIYINCGDQDEYGFYTGASQMHKQLTAEGIRHEFHLYPGRHSADYFSSHLGETIQFHWQAFAVGEQKVK